MCVIFVLCCIIMSQFFVGLRVIENVFARFIYKLFHVSEVLNVHMNEIYKKLTTIK